MKLIPLTQGKFAKVDDEDYEWLMQWKWHFNNRYAMRWQNYKKLRMHREIMKVSDDLEIDHIDNDGLNNCKNNLRICTTAQNSRNRVRAINNTSGYKGVTWHKRGKKWQAYIKLNGKSIYIGFYNTAEEAADAYDFMAKQYYGEYANLNFQKE